MGSFLSATALSAAVAFAEGAKASSRSLASTISHHLLALFASLPTVLLSMAIQSSLS